MRSRACPSETRAPSPARPPTHSRGLSVERTSQVLHVDALPRSAPRVLRVCPPARTTAWRRARRPATWECAVVRPAHDTHYARNRSNLAADMPSDPGGNGKRRSRRTLVYDDENSQECGAAHSTPTSTQDHWYRFTGNRLALKEQHRDNMQGTVYW